MTLMYAQDDTVLWAHEPGEYFCDKCGQGLLDFGYPAQEHPWYCVACEEEYEREYQSRPVNRFREDIVW